MISTVPGPDFSLYLCGASVATHAGRPAPRRRLNITCFSCRGSIDFGCVTTPEIASDIADMADAIELALAELEVAAWLRTNRLGIGRAIGRGRNWSRAAPASMPTRRVRADLAQRSLLHSNSMLANLPII